MLIASTKAFKADSVVFVLIVFMIVSLYKLRPFRPWLW
jgi:hypothetical protein